MSQLIALFFWKNSKFVDLVSFTNIQFFCLKFFQINRVQQAELLRRRVAFMNTRSTPMIPPQAALCAPQNTASNVGLLPQMQSNAMSQQGKLNVGPMQGNQMANQMMNPNTMASMNAMNANSGMIGTNAMMSNTNQMQQQQMNTGGMMSPSGPMNVNNPMGNNPMNPGSMMNPGNNQMVGNMNNMNQVNPMTSNAGNQMQQQTQQVI